MQPWQSPPLGVGVLVYGTALAMLPLRGAVGETNTGSFQEVCPRALPLFPSPIAQPAFPLLLPVVTPQTQGLPLAPARTSSVWLVLQSGRPRSLGTGGHLTYSVLAAQSDWW